MIIELPEKFSKVYNNGWYVIIREGVLEIHGGCNYRELMNQVTYALKGRTRCYYCHKIMRPEACTIDHLFPQDFGGVSITNNLEPSCGQCNSHKSNMNEMEFKVWRTISSEEARKKYCKKAITRKMTAKYDSKRIDGFDLPRDWVTIQKLDLIQKATRTHGEARYLKTCSFIEEHNKLPVPLVLSQNQVVLSGIAAYAAAKEKGLKVVPVIILENVMFYDQ